MTTSSSEEEIGQDQALFTFNNFNSEWIDDMPRRTIALMHVDDEMFGWIKRLEAWSKTDAMSDFRANAYIVQLHLCWFAMTNLVKQRGTMAAWTKPHLKADERERFLFLMNKFRRVFAYFETLNLPGE